MTSAPEPSSTHGGPEAVEMPKATIWPLVLSLGVTLLLGGLATNLAFSAVGAVLTVAGLAGWIGQLLPGKGHAHEPLVEPAQRARPVAAELGKVAHLKPGMPGYRFRLPEKVHPISAGVKGGIVGGLVMLIPALLYGLLSGHGVWYPANLLAGMVLPGVETMSVSDLEQFRLGMLIPAILSHVVISLVLGLIYGVLLPTLPAIPREVAWGGLLMPLLWTGAGYPLLGIVNPVLKDGVNWPLFIASQLLFGVVVALVVRRFEWTHPILTGTLGGVVAALLMAVPASLWGLATRNGIWYPINLLAGMVVPGMDQLPVEELRQFNPTWLTAAVVVHGTLSVAFGAVYGVLLPKLPAVPAPLPWGALLMPLVWTAASYGLMGVLNPLLQQRVDWPWFVVSQFVFGAAAAVVVIRSEQIFIPPAGLGPEPLENWVAGGPGEERS